MFKNAKTNLVEPFYHISNKYFIINLVQYSHSFTSLRNKKLDRGEIQLRQYICNL